MGLTRLMGYATRGPITGGTAAAAAAAAAAGMLYRGCESRQWCNEFGVEFALIVG